MPICRRADKHSCSVNGHLVRLESIDMYAASAMMTRHRWTETFVAEVNGQCRGFTRWNQQPSGRRTLAVVLTGERDVFYFHLRKTRYAEKNILLWLSTQIFGENWSGEHVLIVPTTTPKSQG